MGTQNKKLEQSYYTKEPLCPPVRGLCLNQPPMSRIYMALQPFPQQLEQKPIEIWGGFAYAWLQSAIFNWHCYHIKWRLKSNLSKNGHKYILVTRMSGLLINAILCIQYFWNTISARAGIPAFYWKFKTPSQKVRRNTTSQSGVRTSSPHNHTWNNDTPQYPKKHKPRGSQSAFRRSANNLILKLNGSWITARHERRWSVSHNGGRSSLVLNYEPIHHPLVSSSSWFRNPPVTCSFSQAWSGLKWKFFERVFRAAKFTNHLKFNILHPKNGRKRVFWTYQLMGVVGVPFVENFGGVDDS